MTKSLALAAVLIAAFAGPALAAKLRVPRDFATIQAAVDAAVDGDVIEISGSHAESVYLGEVNGVTLVGKGRATITPLTAEGHGIELLDCDRVTIRNLRFRGGDRGVFVRASSDVTVERCRFDETGNAGVDVRDSSDVFVSRCRVEDTQGEGITFGDADGDEPVTRGEISRCFVRNTVEEGVRVVGTDLLVTRSTTVLTGDDGFDANESPFSARIRFEKCKSISSGDEGFRTDIPGTEFVKCFSSGADEEGFDVQASECLVQKCRTRGCRRGIEIQNAAGGLVTKCKVVKPEQIGILVDSSIGVRVERSTVVKAGEHGVEVRFDSSDLTFFKVRATRSGEFDLRDKSGGETNAYERSRFKSEDLSEEVQGD